MPKTKKIEENAPNNVDLRPLEGLSKSNAMSVVMKAMAVDDPDKWVKIFNAVQAAVGHEADSIAPDTAAKNAASVVMKGAIKEDIANLFGGDESLSEEMRAKVLTLFESAVNARVAILEADLQEAYDAKLETETEALFETLVESVDKYISYGVKTWIEENEVAIETTLRGELMEEFFGGLSELYRTHNFNIPNDQIEVTNMLADKNDELEEALNHSINENMELVEALEAMTKKDIINEITEGLTFVDKEKFITLVEGFEIEDVDTYTEKLETIKHHHFGGQPAKAKSKLITEEIEYSDEVALEDRPVSADMKPYVDALKRTRTPY